MSFYVRVDLVMPTSRQSGPTEKSHCQTGWMAGAVEEDETRTPKPRKGEREEEKGNWIGEEEESDVTSR